MTEEKKRAKRENLRVFIETVMYYPGTEEHSGKHTRYRFIGYAKSLKKREPAIYNEVVIKSRDRGVDNHVPWIAK